jgi:tRNA nucleotidyltransferase (CCA-adding enzyme)
VISTTPEPAALRARLRAALPHAAVDALDALLDAAGHGVCVCAVGGTVRDLLLGRPFLDLDLVAETDAAALMRRALPRTRVVAHARFGTATATVGGIRIDLATARRETYARPGVLPRTTPATLADDLVRRDFSCNAVALSLSGPPDVVDPAGGVEDIAAMHVRVMHDASFVHDPTRVFRAFRYAARLDFTIEHRTASLLTSALPFVARVGGERLRREVELMLGDEPPGAALEAAHTAGALQAIHPALHWSAAKTDAYQGGATMRDAAEYGFALLASGASTEESDEVVARLRLKRAEIEAVRGVAALRGVSDLLRRPELKPSGAALLLDRFPPAAIAAYARTTGNSIAREIMLRYLDLWRDTRPMLSGRDLIDMGVPEGPQVQRGLQLVRAARLDGWAQSRDDERALVMRFAKSIRDSDAAHTLVEFEPGGE